MAPGSPSFTEEQWLTSADPADMISVIFPKATERQMRLFMTACCRRVWKWMPPVCREAVEVMDRATDNLGQFQMIRLGFPPAALNVALEPEVGAVSEWYSALAAFGLALTPLSEEHVRRLTWFPAAAVAVDGLIWPDDSAWRRVVSEVRRGCYGSFENWDQNRLMAVLRGGPEELSRFPGWAKERQAQAELLRHIVGNPFRPYPAPGFWPSTVAELAQAVYDRTGDHRILSDCVEEAGHRELAEHFRRNDWHPKGCWGLDLILGKGR